MDKHEFPTLALGLVLYASWAGLVWFGNAIPTLALASDSIRRT